MAHEVTGQDVLGAARLAGASLSESEARVMAPALSGLLNLVRGLEVEPDVEPGLVYLVAGAVPATAPRPYVGSGGDGA